MQNIIFTQIPIDEFKNVLSETVREELQKLNTSQPQQQETEYITRQETARILGISLPTLHDWTKKGVIVGYRISTRVRYRKNEILEALQQVQTLKYRRD
jgi:excisionase family DNA binding protein